MTQLNINLGGVGSVQITPNKKDLQIAHQVWVELVTRKAAIEIDPENDVILEVYDSWYQLFGRVRSLLADIPGELIKEHESTKQLTNILVKTLNQGLRPHLTKWQARYRHWHAIQREKNPEIPPQDLQKQFPEYEKLSRDMMKVNAELRRYADQLQKLFD